jgi:lysozyme family protein
MRDGLARALAFTLKYEGGWSDHPNDPGGATMKGVTRATYEAYLDRPVSKAELRAIPDAHLLDIYETRYWKPVRGDDLPGGLDMCVFDFAVNSGIVRASKALQTLVGAPEDGKIGDQTLAALVVDTEQQGVPALVRAYNGSRMHFLRGLNTWPTFGRGWTARVNALTQEALKVA